MKRHRALIPLSHDHHHALVEARRLRRAAESDGDPQDAVAAFVHFFRTSSVPHFREEEESLFPLVAGEDEAQPLVVEALLDHQRLHALAARLQAGDEVRATMRELGRRLEAHVRLEERRLFPLIERLVSDRLDQAMAMLGGGGPVWGEASEDLNATLLEWSEGAGTPEHVNDERDVLVFVVDGSATVTIDGDDRELAAGEAVIVPKGRRRSIGAGRGGVRYLSVHLRRPPLQIRPAPDR
jgi:mannose-6-phosphate isomerase-like protein (cupin superfamily)